MFKPVVGADDVMKVKEQRLNRVGLSYNCKRCGLPKKGHVCLMEEKDDKVEAKAKAKEEAKGKAKEEAKEKKPAKAKSSSSTDATIASQPPPASEAAAEKKKATGTKRRKQEDDDDVPSDGPMPPPPVMCQTVAAGLAVPVKAARRSPRRMEVSAEDAALLEELEFEQPPVLDRPPSLITPEDSEVPRCGPSSVMSTISAPPASLASASNIFSPGQFMASNFLDTPTGMNSVALSPGTLAALGATLTSPGLRSGLRGGLRSAGKR